MSTVWKLLPGSLVLAFAIGCASPEAATRPDPMPESKPELKPELKTEQAPPLEASKPAESEAALPPAADRAPVTDGDVTEAWVRGMQILVKKNPTAELVAGQMAIKGGAYNWDGRTAGVEQLLTSVMESGGTTKLDKDAFARRLATLGSSIGGAAGADYSMIAFKSLQRNWEETFGLMTDVFLTPALPDSELEIRRSQQLEAIKREEEFPDSRLGLVTHKLLFQGHPYEHRSVGTADNVRGFTREDLVSHLKKLHQTRRLVLVVVGNVEAAQVIALVKQVFANVPEGTYADRPMPQLRFDKATVNVSEEKLPTNYITGVFKGPSWKDPEFAAAMVAMNALRNRLWDEVRTKRNLSYAPSAGLTLNSRVPRGSIYVTAVDANTTIKVMLDEAKKIAAEPIPEKELAGSKEVFRTGYLMGSETTDGQAGLMVRCQLYGGDWKLMRTLPQQIREVSAEDVRAFAQKYISKLQMVVLGDPAKIDNDLFQSL